MFGCSGRLFGLVTLSSSELYEIRLEVREGGVCEAMTLNDICFVLSGVVVNEPPYALPGKFASNVQFAF